MGKIIVPKNHIVSGNSTINHTSNISSTGATLNAKIAPEFIYADHDIIATRTIKYSLTSGLITTTSSPTYRINLFDSSSENNKEVRFIKLTLNGFPGYSDTRSKPTTGLALTTLTAKIQIYKKSSSSSYDCIFTKNFTRVNGTCDLNGTYWLTFNPSTKKYTVSTSEPLLISKAIVPDKDNWMNLNSVTEYSPQISTSMTINTEDNGYMCNQPYIGRMISVYSESSSNITISGNTIYNLRINTADKILIIYSIGLSKFIGALASNGIISKPQLTLKIFINDNTTAVYSTSIQVPSYAVGTVPMIHSIGVSNPIYIDVMNNETFTSGNLSKAIDDF